MYLVRIAHSPMQHMKDWPCVSTPLITELGPVYFKEKLTGISTPISLHMYPPEPEEALHMCAQNCLISCPQIILYL